MVSIVKLLCIIKYTDKPLLSTGVSYKMFGFREGGSHVYAGVDPELLFF